MLTCRCLLTRTGRCSLLATPPAGNSREGMGKHGAGGEERGGGTPATSLEAATTSFPPLQFRKYSLGILRI